jgi:hypothetical protein
MDSQQMPEAIQVRIHPQTGKGVYFVKNFDTTALARPIFSWAGRTPRDDLIHPEEHLPKSSSRPKAENSPISKAKP